MKKPLFILSLLLLPLLASADAVKIDGIYYNLNETTGQAEVTKNPKYYSGSIVIPESVLYDRKTYSVTSIGNEAFASCSGLISIKVESGNPKYDSRNDCNAIIETSSNRYLSSCARNRDPCVKEGTCTENFLCMRK